MEAVLKLCISGDLCSVWNGSCIEAVYIWRLVPMYMYMSIAFAPLLLPMALPCLLQSLSVGAFWE